MCKASALPGADRVAARAHSDAEDGDHIIQYLAESFPEELLNLPPRPHQRMKEPEGA